MWNVYGSTVLFSYAEALNIVSIESGRSEGCSNEEWINKGWCTIQFDLQTPSLEYISTYLDAPGPAAERTVGKGGTLLVLRLLIDTDLSDTHRFGGVIC